MSSAECKVKTSELLKAALQYASLGYPVFPCQPGDKIPYEGTHGFKDASTDPATIRAWWERWPTANVAIATAGLVVIDIDGPDNLWPNDERGEDLAACGAQSVTPRGGQHYWFRQPEGKAWRNTESRLAPKVDTRADGGYALVSPSVVNESSYQWAEGCELDVPPSRLAEPPAWVVAELDALKEKKKPVAPPNKRKDEKPFTKITPSDEPARAWARAALEGECQKVAIAVPGTRNSILNSCAFTVGGHVGAGNLSMEEAEEALFQAAKEAGCDDDKKDLSTIRRALQDGMGKPLHAPDSESEPGPPSKSKDATKKGGPQKNEKLITRLRWRRASDIQVEPLHWIAEGILPRGKLTVFFGDGAAGKSSLSLHLATAISQGVTPFGLNHAPALPPSKVAMYGCEDGVEDTHVPRLMGMGADLEKIHFLEGVDIVSEDGEVKDAGTFTVRDVDKIREHLSENRDVRLLIVDPIAEALGGDADAHRDNEVRAVLKPLIEVAKEFDLTILAVAHVNKSADVTTAANKIMGSVGLKNLARSAAFIVRDKQEPEYAYLAQAKANLTGRVPSRRFRTEVLPEAEAVGILKVSGNAVGRNEDDLVKVAKAMIRLVDFADDHRTADELLVAVNGKGEGNAEKAQTQEQGEQWVADRLAKEDISLADIIKEGNLFIGTNREERWWKARLNALGASCYNHPLSGNWMWTALTRLKRVEMAQEWLRQRLANCPRPVSELKKLARKEEPPISATMLDEVAASIGVVVKMEGLRHVYAFPDQESNPNAGWILSGGDDPL